MKKILITGNSGYIGSHLTKLLETEYEVHGFDLQNPLINPHKHNELDIRKAFNIDDEYDAVIHLAALVNIGESERFPISYYITNINGTMNVINKIKCKNFILASTGSAEQSQSVYSRSKRAAEDVVIEYCTKHSPKDFSIFRFYNVIGGTVAAPTNPDGLMYNLIKAMHTGEFTIFGNDYSETSDGTCLRDYVHVNEICEALKLAVENPSNNIECLGHGVGRTVYEMACIFQDVNNCEFEIKYGPRRKGDLPISVLKDVSPYMKNLYSFEELLKI